MEIGSVKFERHNAISLFSVRTILACNILAPVYRDRRRFIIHGRHASDDGKRTPGCLLDHRQRNIIPYERLTIELTVLLNDAKPFNDRRRGVIHVIVRQCAPALRNAEGKIQLFLFGKLFVCHFHIDIRHQTGCKRFRVNVPDLDRRAARPACAIYRIERPHKIYYAAFRVMRKDPDFCLIHPLFTLI